MTLQYSLHTTLAQTMYLAVAGGKKRLGGDREGHARCSSCHHEADTKKPFLVNAVALCKGVQQLGDR
jgi:hypothetical protein